MNIFHGHRVADLEKAERHGANAAIVAERCIDRMFYRGNSEGHLVWQRLGSRSLSCKPHQLGRRIELKCRPQGPRCPRGVTSERQGGPDG